MKKKDTVFDYSYLAKDMWREVVTDAMDLFNIRFDLENDEPTSEGFTEKVKGARFACQPCAAGGDWEAPVLYYRCQFIDDSIDWIGPIVSFGEELNEYRNAFFVFIPKPDEGNGHLIKNKKNDGWIALDAEQADSEAIDERKGRKALKKFLEEICSKREEFDPPKQTDSPPVLPTKASSAWLSGFRFARKR